MHTNDVLRQSNDRQPFSILCEAAGGECKPVRIEASYGERRATQRYKMEFELRYSAVGRDGSVLIGRGKTCNISSRGVLFEAKTRLFSGVPVKLSIQWPVSLEGTQPMRLIIVGPTVRSWEKGAAVAIKTHYFVAEAMESQSDADAIKWWEHYLGRRTATAPRRETSGYQPG